MVESKRRVSMLDGLRGLALAAVVAYHVAPSVFPGGFLGVEVFFVLSGYLLASLLLNELQRTGRIDRRSFALRRLRRVGPGLLVLLFALVLLGPVFAPDDAHRLKGDVISSLTGLTNWRLIADGNSYFSQVGRPPLVRHLWSIAIELQFYLVCPFVVGWLAKQSRRKALRYIALGMAASSGLMALAFSSPDPSRAYYGTETRIGALLAGVLLAFILLHKRKAAPRRMVSVWPDRLGMAAVVVLIALLVAADERARSMYPLGFVAVQAATMMTIYAGLRRQRVGEILEQTPLRWLGRRSYGIYLWHWPAVALMRPGIDVGLPAFVTGALSILAAVVLGTLSYRFVEGQVSRPFRRSGARSSKHSLRNSLGPLVRPVLRPAALGVLLLALVGLSAGLPTGDPIAASLREGREVIAEQKPPSASVVIPRAAKGPVLVLTPVAEKPAAPPPPPVAPRNDLRVTAIGDSVMVSAAGALQARLGPGSYIDATLGRRSIEYVELIRKLRTEGRLGEVVVVHLGNNGEIKPGRIDALMSELSSVPNVIMVSVRVSKPWQEATNRALAEANSRYPNLKLVDWHAASGRHPEWFASDGTHLKPRGANAFADLIAAAMPPPPPAPPNLVVEPVVSPPPLPGLLAVLPGSAAPGPVAGVLAPKASESAPAVTAAGAVPRLPAILLGTPGPESPREKAAAAVSKLLIP